MMKRILTLAMAICISLISFAQTTPSFSADELKSKDDLNPVAQKAASYILATPVDTTSKMRTDAEQYLLVWMTETKDYSFTVDNAVVRVMEDNKLAGFVVFAAMTDYVMNNKGKSEDEVRLYAMKRLLTYASNPANNLVPGTEIKKMIAADKKGKLKEYLAEVNAP